MSLARRTSLSASEPDRHGPVSHFIDEPGDASLTIIGGAPAGAPAVPPPGDYRPRYAPGWDADVEARFLGKAPPAKPQG